MGNHSLRHLQTLVLHFGVEIWETSIFIFTWKEFENVQKCFVTKFLQLMQQTSYIVLLLEIGSLYIEIMAKERLLNTCQIGFPRIACDALKKIQKKKKKQKWVLWCKIWRNYWKIGCDTFTLESINRFLDQWSSFTTQCIMTWVECGASLQS